MGIEENKCDSNETDQINGCDFKGEVADDFPCFNDTMPIDDTFLYGDAFETQFVDLAGETQVMDNGGETYLAGETQVMDFGGETCLAGETQVMDFDGETQFVDDLDFIKNMNTELLSEPSAEVVCVSDSEGTTETQVLCDHTQQVFQDDYVEVDSGDLVGRENNVDSYNVSGAAPSDILDNGKLSHSGSVCRGFTSIRTASMRASGLAALARGTRSNSCSISSDIASMEQQTFQQVGSLKKNNVEYPWNDNNEEKRNKIVSKLVMEDGVAIETPDFLVPGICLAGLSYANSQEPGELSQANALEAVNKFLEINVPEYDLALEPGIEIIKKKPKVVSGVKGSRDLARNSILRTSDRDCGIYDWDTNREDEGGGEFFLKKKEHFFDKRSSKQRKGDHVDEKEPIYNKKKLGAEAKGKSLSCGEEVFHKISSKNSDEQTNMASGEKMSENNKIKDIPDVNDIGPDTQIAVEAMENLCFEVNLADSNIDIPSENAENTKRATRKNQYSKNDDCLKNSSSFGAVTREAKQVKRTSIETGKDSSLSEINVQKERREGKRTVCHELDPVHSTRSTVQGSEKKRPLQEQPGFSVPVAHRTRKCSELNLSKDAENPVGDKDNVNDLIRGGVVRKRRTARNKNAAAENPVGHKDSVNDLISGRVVRKRRTARDKNAVIVTIEQLKKVRSIGINQLKGKRTRQEKMAAGQEEDEGQRNNVRLKRSKTITEGISFNSVRNQTEENVNNESLIKEKEIVDDAIEVSVSKQFDSISEGAEANDKLEASPTERCRASFSNCTTPATCSTPVNKPSPICVGDEYSRKSCRKSLSRSSLMKEINDLISSSPEPKEARKRRDISNIRVLFSQHLDGDVIKQQKKILVRVGAQVASSMSDATHFVADEFVRTKNMLEAIALGKPVVTHLWLESCGQASCLIDEKSYILRDARKEKEFGFCMAVSLSRASQHPLLQGQKVFITPNTKPGQDILANLVKAVGGLAVERVGRSMLKDQKIPDDLLILSCEEDYDVCAPFLEKGGSVYSSELLLNGIVIQKLEYDRHRLFTDNVKKTRSTIWVKQKNRYRPATKCK